MNIVVKLYGAFRPQEGEPKIALSLCDGSTIDNALQVLVSEKPELAAVLFDDQGALSDTANVFVNGLNARGLTGEPGIVQEGDVLFITSAFGGG
jgi:molybdopterin converting factor small subunit